MAFLRLLSIAGSINIVIAASITSLPTARNTTLYSNVTFECTTNGGPAYWIINGTDTPSRDAGMTVKPRQLSGTEHHSTLCIYATAANNNTQVQCGVFDITSPPVLLLIQGRSFSPRNVRINFTAYSQIDLIWEEPPTQDMISNNVFYYLVTIVNLNNGTERVVNTTKNEYIFIREDYVHCDVFRFHVAGYNEVGMGYQSEGIEAAFLGPTIINSAANVSLIDESATFHCCLLCDEPNIVSQVVTWFINNNTVTNMDPSSYQTTSDHHNCRSGALNYTETLKINIPSFIASEGHDVINDVVTIYCGVVSLTNKVEYERDRDSVTLCYSRDAFLEVTIPEMNQNTSQSQLTLPPGTSPGPQIDLLNNTTTTSPDTDLPGNDNVPEDTSSENNWLLLAICIGQAALLILFALISIGVVVCVMIKKSQVNKRQVTKPDDSVYALPFSLQSGGKNDETKSSSNRVAIELESVDTDGERIYDQPKTPSPQPDMQPCAAYHTTQRHHH